MPDSTTPPPAVQVGAVSHFDEAAPPAPPPPSSALGALERSLMAGAGVPPGGEIYAPDPEKVLKAMQDSLPQTRREYLTVPQAPPRVAPLDQVEVETKHYVGGKITMTTVQLESRDEAIFEPDPAAVEARVHATFSGTLGRFKDTPECAALAAARRRLATAEAAERKATETLAAASAAYSEALDCATNGEAGKTFAAVGKARAALEAARQVLGDLRQREAAARDKAESLLAAALKENRSEELQRTEQTRAGQRAELAALLKGWLPPFELEEGVQLALRTDAVCFALAVETVAAAGNED